MTIKTRGYRFPKGGIVITGAGGKDMANAIAKDRREFGYKDVKVIRAFHLDKLHHQKMYQVIGRRPE